MIELLSQWVQTVVLLLLFVAFVQLLLPDHPLRDYTRMVLGLVVIAAVLSPLLALLDPQTWQGEVLGALGRREGTQAIRTVPDRGADEWVRRGAGLAARAQRRVEMEVRGRLHDQVRSLASLVPGVGDVRVETNWDPDGRLREMVISIQSLNGDPGVGERVRQVVGSFFSVEPSRIRVELDKGG